MNLKQELLDSIDIIVNQKTANLKFDKTLKGTVTDILKNNYYQISISGVNHKLKYTKDELKLYSSVYVLIPNGDSKNMFILCPTNP